MKPFFIWFWFIVTLPVVEAQCDFNDTLMIPDQGTTGLNLLISNAAINDLADPTQGVCGVLIKFKHDVIGDLNISLISPSNQLVQLVGSGGTSSGFTDGASWDIQFTPCASPASPDPGFGSFWSNEEFWQAFQQYSGTYYPFSGCLEDFNQGPVNGTWTLLIEDVAELDEGVIEYFSILFCDDTAIDCSPCNPPAQKYSSDSIEICQGVVFDPENLSTVYLTNNQDTLNYASVHMIFGPSGFLGTTADTLISALNPGSYQFCLLGYHQSDSTYVADLPKNFQDSITSKILLEKGICGLVNDCLPFTILPVGDTIIVNKTLCEGETLLFQDQIFTNEGVYYVSDTSGKCDTIYELMLDVFDLSPEVSLSFPLLDCNHSEISIVLSGIQDPQNAIITWTTFNGNMVSEPIGDSLVVNAKGFYTYHIVNGACSWTDSIFVDADLDLPTVSLVPGILNCDSINTLIQVSSSSILSSVNWSGPVPFQQIGLDIRVFMPGVYVAEITDQNGCIVVKTIEISLDDAKPVLDFNVFPINCLRPKGYIQVNDSFNIQTIEWSGLGAESPSDINSLLSLPGIYALKLTGFNGCDTTIQLSIPDESYVVDVVVLPDTITCAKNAVTLTVFSGRVVVDQQWQFPDLSSSNIFNPVVTAPGTYKVTVMDTEGCMGETSVVVAIDTVSPALIVTDRMIDCDSTQVKLKVDNAVPGWVYDWSGPNFFTSMDATPVVNQAGAYRVMVTDQNGCAASATIQVSLSQDLPEVNFTIDTITCLQPIALITPVDTTGIDFLWLTNGMLNPPTFFQGSVDTQGSYIVRVTDRSNGCKRDYFLAVTDGRTIPDYNAVSDTLDCEKTLATLKIEGNIQITSWLWTGNAFSSVDPMPSVSNPGWYRVELTDVFNCVFIDSVEVRVADDVPDVTITGSQLTCINNEAILTANADPSVTFTWKLEDLTLGTGRSISVFNIGVYTVIAKGEGNCFDTTTFEVIYDTLSPLLIPAPLLTLTCIRDSVELSVSSNETLASGTWTGPSLSGLDTSSVWVKLPGNYRYTAVDTAGCQSFVDIVVVSEKEFLTFDTLVNEITCKTPGEVEIIFSDPPSQLIWIASPTQISDGTLSFEATTAGLYSFEATNAQGCITTGQIMVLADTLRPDLTGLTDAQINCIDSLVTIGFISGLSPGTEVLWDFGSKVTDTIQVKQAGFYSGTLTASNGCTRDFEVEVGLNVDLPVFQTRSDTIDCIQSKTDIEVIGSQVYKSVTWLGPLGEVYQGQSVKVDKPGYYFAIVEGENGCIAKDSVEVLSDFSIPQLLLADSFYLPCDGSGVLLEANASIPLLSFRWVGIDQTFFSTDPAPRILIPTKVRLSASGANGCEAHDTTLVILSPLRPLFGIIGDTLGCNPLTASLIATNVADDKNFYWINEAGEQWLSDTLMVSAAGTYRLIVTANNGCSDSLSFVVPIDTLAPAVAIRQTKPFICDQREINIEASIEELEGGYDYQWGTSDGNFIGNIDTLAPKINQPGTYQITVTNNDNGCVTVQNYRIEELPNPIENVRFIALDPLCFNEPTGSIEMEDVAGASLPLTFSVNGNVVNGLKADQLAAGEFLLEIKDSIGCTWDSVVVLNEGHLVQIVLPNDTMITPGDELVIPFTSVPAGLNWQSIEWQTLPGGNVVCANCLFYSLIPDEDLQILVLAKDSLGCVASDTLLIKLSESVALSFPNVFQPGSGGINGTFYIPEQAGLDIIEFLRIYDNWGNLVFSAVNMIPGKPEDGWDGQLNGCPLQPGVYVYQMKIRLKSGNTLLITKDLTLVR